MAMLPRITYDSSETMRRHQQQARSEMARVLYDLVPMGTGALSLQRLRHFTEDWGHPKRHPQLRQKHVMVLSTYRKGSSRRFSRTTCKRNPNPNVVLLQLQLGLFPNGGSPKSLYLTSICPFGNPR